MERDLFGSADLKRSFEDGQGALNQSLARISSEFFELNVCDHSVSEIQCGASVNDKNTTMVALVIKDVGEMADTMIGYFDLKSGKFKSQKKLIVKPDGDSEWEDIHRQNQFCVNNEHIYTIARIRNDYEIPASSSASQIEMYVKVDLIMNTEFKKEGFQAPNSKVDDTQPGPHDFTPSFTPTEITEPYPMESIIGKDLLGGNNCSPEDATSLVDNGGMEIETDAMEFQFMDGLQTYQKNDYQYLNLTNWPRTGFKFSLKPGGGYVFSVPDGEKIMTKVKSRDLITMKLREVMKGPSDPTVDGRSRGKWCFEDRYDYFLAPLEDQMQKKVYTKAFMNENFECLKNVIVPKNPKPGFNMDQYDSSVMNKVKKHYGFLEIFKKLQGQETKYEPTGKLHYLSYQIRSEILLCKIDVMYITVSYF